VGGLEPLGPIGVYAYERDRRRYRFENENVDENYVVVRKIEKVVVVSGSRGLQKTELQDLLLGVVM